RRPVEASEGAGPPVTERVQDLGDESFAIDSAPVRGAPVRTGGVQEVVTAHPYGTGQRLDQVACESGLPCSAESGDPDDQGADGGAAAGHDQIENLRGIHRASLELGRR